MEQQIAQALEAASFSHSQYEIELGVSDEHWAQWYAKWLLSESEVSDILSQHYHAQQLSLLLTTLDGLYHEGAVQWSSFYGQQIAKELIYDEVPVAEDPGPESDV